MILTYESRYIDQWNIIKSRNKPLYLKVLANHICDEALTTRLYKELLEFNNKTTTTGCVYTFLYITYTNGQEAVKRYSSLVIEGMQTKTTPETH